MSYMETYDLSDFNPSPALFQKLLGIFRSTIHPDMTEEELYQYVWGRHPDSVEASFIYQDEELAGFCTSAAYPWRCNGKKIVIMRSAFGLNDKFKKGNFPLQGLFYKYIRYKLRHLFTPVYVAGFMANPLMYAMICKYTATSYPRRNEPVSAEITELKKTILQCMHLTEEVAPFVTKIDFQVRFNELDLHRFRTTTNQDAVYYQTINPNYTKQMGVLVIVPVTIANMSYTFCKYLTKKLSKRIGLFNGKTEKDSKPTLSKA